MVALAEKSPRVDTFDAWVADLAATPVEPTPEPTLTPEPSPTPEPAPEVLHDPSLFEAAVLDRLDTGLLIGTVALVVVVLLVAVHVFRTI